MRFSALKALIFSTLLLPGVTFAALESNESIAKVDLANSTNYERIDEVVSFDLFDLGLRANDPRASQLVAKSDDGDIPTQAIDDNGDGVFDRLIVLLDFGPAEKRSIEIVVDPVAANARAFPKRTQAEVSRKVGGKWEGTEYVGGTFANTQSLSLPAHHKDHSYYIRYEGIGIESEKVGYRVYLDPRNGFDIFSKSKYDLVLHNVGLDGFDSYHELADWGVDTLKVGPSLGCGGYGFWNGKSAERISKVDGWEASIIHNDHLHSSFRVKYKGWDISGKKVDLDATHSMQAGSNLVHVNLDYSENPGSTAIGIVKSEGIELIEGNRDISNFGAWTYIATWGKQSLTGDQLGMAIFFQRSTFNKLAEDEYSHIVVAKPASSYNYYYSSIWEKEPNGIDTKEKFIAYLEEQTEKLTIPVRKEVVTSLDLANKTAPITAEAALDYSVRISESEMKRLGFDLALSNANPALGKGKWSYTTGLLMQAMDDASVAGNRADLRSYADRVISSFIEDDGTITGYDASNFNIDSINSGKYLLRLWERTGEEKYKTAAGHLRAQLVDHPRTSEGAFWHKQIYPNQIWLDGVYMGMPFLARYSELFEKGKHTKEAIHEFEIARKHMRDPKSGLYYHGWDESREQAWADSETGLSDEFWGRGLGWYTMAMVDVMDFVPEKSKALRKSMIDMIGEMAAALVDHQDPKTGTWYQVMDKPDQPGNYTESSASSMFVYFMAKAINQGYLSEDYKEAVIRGYQGLIDEFITHHADGSLSLKDVCKVAGLGYGRDGTYRYYMTEEIVDNGPHGVGPFIMAGVEVSKLLSE